MSKKLILGGVFATHTEMDEQGNVTQRDEFHTRLYWDLWNSGAMMKLKGARLHVLLTIAQHADKNGEGFPGVRRLAQLLPYSKNAISKAITELIKLGFLERTQNRGKAGKFGNNHYAIRYTSSTPENTDFLPCPKNTDTDKTPENTDFLPCPKNTDTVKTVYGKVGHKEDIYSKKEQQQEEQKNVVVASSKSEKKKDSEKDQKAKALQERFQSIFKQSLSLPSARKFIELGEQHHRDVINDSLVNTAFALKHKMDKTGEKPHNPAGALRTCIIEGWEVAAPKPKQQREFRNYDVVDPAEVEFRRQLVEEMKAGANHE